jgi:hypothetical protein
MYTNKKEFKKILESLPTNSLMVIAGELMSMDTGEDVSPAIDSLLCDIMNIGEQRLGADKITPFCDLINHWYLSGQKAVIGEWYQAHLIEAMEGQFRPRKRAIPSGRTKP